MKFVAPLNDVEIQTLTDMHRFHPSRRARMRAHGILLSHQGFSMRRIADIYQVSRYAVSAWIERWHSAGLVGLGEIGVREQFLDSLPGQAVDCAHKSHGSLIFIMVLRIYNALYFLPLYHFHIFL